jgi:hypothetical protein
MAKCVSLIVFKISIEHFKIWLLIKGARTSSKRCSIMYVIIILIIFTPCGLDIPLRSSLERLNQINKIGKSREGVRPMGTFSFLSPLVGSSPETLLVSTFVSRWIETHHSETNQPNSCCSVICNPDRPSSPSPTAKSSYSETSPTAFNSVMALLCRP